MIDQSISDVIPIPNPTTVMHAITAAMGIANKKSTPRPMAGAVLLHELTASKKKTGIRKSITSPNKKLAPHFRHWCT